MATVVTTATTMTTNSAHLVILARKAEIGVGKTRLAATVGAKGAYDIYRQLITLTSAAASASGLNTTVLFDPEPGDADIWNTDFFQSGVQLPSDNLGDRIAHALSTGLEARKRDQPRTTPSTGSLVIGTDCPQLSPKLLCEASDALLSHDAVLGPVRDGGFYLLGLKQLPQGLLRSIEWSTAAVADQTRRAFTSQGWSWHELATLTDVDIESDWQDYLKKQSVSNT